MLNLSSFPQLRGVIPIEGYALLPTRPTSGRFQQYQGYPLSIPSISQNLFGAVPRAAMTSGTTITFTRCIPRTSKANFWYRSIFQASVVAIFRSSGTATLIIIHCCLSFRVRVIPGLLCCMRLSVIIVLSLIIFTWSFSITGRGWCSYQFSPFSRPYLLLNSQ